MALLNDIPADLPPFARGFYQWFADRHPDLFAEANVVIHNGNMPCLHFGESEHSSVECAYVSADEGETTIGFGPFWHDHIPMFDEGRPDEAYYHEATQLLTDILKEERVVIQKLSILGGYQCMPPEEAIELWNRKPTKIAIRSFHGTHDRDPSGSKP